VVQALVVGGLLAVLAAVLILRRMASLRAPRGGSAARA
jgi:hypothetical protein